MLNRVISHEVRAERDLIGRKLCDCILLISSITTPKDKGDMLAVSVAMATSQKGGLISDCQGSSSASTLAKGYSAEPV